jgi:hypothetical protein
MPTTSYLSQKEEQTIYLISNLFVEAAIAESIPNMSITETLPKKSSSLYGGDVLVEFNPEAKRDRYKITDKGGKIKVPSVTTITGLADLGKSGRLQGWAVNMCLEVLRSRIKPDQIHGAQFLEDAFADAKANYRNVTRSAADVGTKAHQALERYFSGDEEFAPPLSGTPVRARFDEAIKWFKSQDVKNICTETVVYSRQHGYVGTCDNISHIKGVISLLDYKSSRHIYNTHALQLAAYVRAREEEFPETKIEQIYVLQIGEEKTIPYRYGPEDIEIAFSGFLGLLQMYKADKKLGKVKPEETDWIEEL